MDVKEREYFDSVMCDVADLITDPDKQLVIVSSGKSVLAYEAAVMMNDRCGGVVRLAQLRCEDGELHEHAFLGDSWLTVDKALSLIMSAKGGHITRPRLQYDLGNLLGHDENAILDFIASKVARDCPCDCCGGPFVNMEISG